MAIPPLPRGMRIQNTDGTVSADFARWWQQNIAGVKQAQSQAVAAVSQAATAAATANSAGSGLASGSAPNVEFDCNSGTRVVVAAVPLTGITAGTLRFDTTAIYALYPLTKIANGTQFFGTFWITEQLTSGGTKNDLYTGTWSGQGEGNGANDADVFIDDPVTLDAARPTVGITGNVTYRLEVARTSGAQIISKAYADFRAAKAS